MAVPVLTDADRAALVSEFDAFNRGVMAARRACERSPIIPSATKAVVLANIDRLVAAIQGEKK